MASKPDITQETTAEDDEFVSETKELVFDDKEIDIPDKNDNMESHYNSLITQETTVEDDEFVSETKELVFDDNKEIDIPDKNDNIKSYYNSLISIFPNVDPEYIRNICTNPPFDLCDNNDCLVMFINHLISYNEHLDESCVSSFESEGKTDDEILSEMLQLQDLQRIEIEKDNEDQLNKQLLSEFLQKDQEIMNEKLDLLISILPDADPEYLKDFIERNHENSMSLEQFVESNLIDRNYVKRGEYYAKRQIKRKLEEYTTNFSVDKFLKQFPEPFEHFESKNRTGMYQEKALNFLKSRYNNFPEEYLMNIYSSNKFNLSLADKEILSTNSSVTYTVPNNFETDDVVLLQEMAFIQNKSSIKLYLDNVKQKEEKELQMLRAKNLLLECQCCYGELKPTECIECDDNHIFCKECVIRGTESAISNGQTSIQCFCRCTKEINLNVLRKVLPENIFEMFLKKCQEAEVKAALNDKLSTCPFCPYQMELASQIKIFTCKNPECMKITCRLCKKMNHLPIRCEDVLDDHKGRLFVEEEMSKALIRNCYKCQKPFVKLDGCNKMICHCGAQMCYICRQPISGYNHFDQGGGCTTHQNSEIFDKEQVELRRVQATSKLRNDFPDMKIPDTL